MENVVEQVKPEVEKAKEVVTEEQTKLQEALHRVMLAAVGTVGLVQDELRALRQQGRRARRDCGERSPQDGARCQRQTQGRREGSGQAL